MKTIIIDELLLLNIGRVECEFSGIGFQGGFIEQDERSAGQDLLDFSTYSGFNGSDRILTNTDRLGNGEGSPIDYRYINDPEPEPNLAFSYAELEFTLAEAAQRGWITNDAAIHYQAGIEASMEYYGISTDSLLPYQINVLFIPGDCIRSH